MPLTVQSGNLEVSSCSRRTVFHDGNYHWCFYVDTGTDNLMYEWSSDGIGWANTPVSAASGVDLRPDWYDVHYAAPATVYIIYGRVTDYDLYAKKGTISGTTISWETAYLVFDGTSSSDHYGVCTIMLDAGGYIWAVVQHRAPTTPYYRLEVKRSTNPNDPSSWGSLTELDSSASVLHGATLGVGSNQVVVVYSISPNTIKSRYFNGTSWETAITATTAHYGGNHFSVVLDSNNVVHLVYVKTDGTLAYASLASPYTGWGSETILDSSTNCTSPVITIDASNTLSVLYIRGTSIWKTIKKSGQSWATPTESITGETSPVELNIERRNNGSNASLSWRGQAAAPYNIRYNYEPTATYTISGVTRDGNGNALGNCAVWLFKTSDKSFQQQTTSDANGNYSFNLGDSITEYFIRSHKDGTPNVFGTTDRGLKGV